MHVYINTIVNASVDHNVSFILVCGTTYLVECARGKEILATQQFGPATTMGCKTIMFVFNRY